MDHILLWVSYPDIEMQPLLHWRQRLPENAHKASGFRGLNLPRCWSFACLDTGQEPGTKGGCAQSRWDHLRK